MGKWLTLADYGIIVGCENFSSDLAKIQFAEEDCTSFFTLLNQSFGIPVEHIAFLVNENATCNQVNESVEKICQQLKQGDRVIMYCATHGKSVYGAPYFACYDAEKDSQPAVSTKGWLGTSQVLGRFAKPTENVECNVLAFLDCCQSTFLCTVRNEFSDCNNNVQISLTGNQYVQVFAAAGATESAHSDFELKHGCWTYYLIRALSGEEPAAFLFNTRRVTASSLQGYLFESVSKRMQKQGQIQTPYEWGAKAEDITIIDYNDLVKDTFMKISEIYFGEIDTDSELQSMPDKEFLQNNYYDLGDIQKFLNEKNCKQIIAGNKGTGKTYLGEYLENNNKNVVYFSVAGITSANIKDVTFAEKSGRGKYKNAWMYALYVLMSLYIIKKKIVGYTKIEPVLSFVLGTNYRPIISNLDGRKSVIMNKRIKRGISAKETTFQDYANESGVVSFDSLIWLLEDTLNQNMKDDCYFFVDGLDENIRGKITEEQQAQLQDLIDASSQVTKNVPSCKNILLIRQDILNQLNGEANLNKVLTARTSYLSWLPQQHDYTQTPLFQFVSKRYETSQKYSGIQSILPFERVLPKHINGYETWPWILEQTTYTPRDIIAFFNACQAVTPKIAETFSAENFWDALPNYSDYLWNEFSDILSGTKLSGKGNEILNILKEIALKHKVQNTKASRSFKCEEFAYAYNKIQQLNGISVITALQILYKSGILGIIQEGNTYWNFRENPINPDEDVITHADFLIHKGLWKITRMW